jgi:hypothetical protein
MYFVRISEQTAIILYGYQNKQPLFPYTGLTNWFLLQKLGVYCAVRTEFLDIVQVHFSY